MATTDPAALRGLSRDELDALATERGVPDPASLANKDAVIEAIIALPPEVTQARQAETAADPDRVSVDEGPPLAQVAEERAARDNEAPELIPAREEV